MGSGHEDEITFSEFKPPDLAALETTAGGKAVTMENAVERCRKTLGELVGGKEDRNL